MAIDVKKLLSEALLELCETKPLSKIKILDVVERSGTGRQTFYNHFLNKNDLINWTWEEYLTNENLLEPDENLYEYTLNVNRMYVKYNKFFVQACALAGQNSLIDYMIQHNRRNFLHLITEKLKEETNAENVVVSDELMYAIDYNAFGATNMHIKWVRAGMPTSPEEFSRQMVNSIPTIMKQYLQVD